MSDDDSICRLCMSVKNLVHTIFEHGFDEKLKHCMSIDVKPNDTLPIYVCALCSLKVKDFYEFKENCSKVQELLFKEYEIKQEVEAEIKGIIDTLKEEELPNELIEYTIEILSSNKDENNTTTNTIPENQKTRIRKPKPKKNNEKNKSKAQKVVDRKEIYKATLTTCDICGKLIEKNRMDGHQNQHLGKRPYLCVAEGCGLTFHCKIALRMHRKNKHSEDKYPCPICGKVYISRKSLYHHTKETHNDKKFSCTDCGQSFVTNARLNRHKIIHIGQRDFECPHCPKSFYRSNNLKIHLRTHSKEKPYKCVLCSKAFGYNRLLKEHVEKVHDK